MQKNNITILEKTVFIGKEELFETRMIIELLPPECYEARLRNINKTAKKKGRTISKEHKAKMTLNIFITNTNIEAKLIREIYSIRWQIELVFKVWKSVLEIHKVKKMKVQRFETLLYAKL